MLMYLGVDIVRNVFQLYGVDVKGKIVQEKRAKSSEFKNP